MPELPEVETVKQAIEEAVLGHNIVDVQVSGKKMRWPIPENISDQINNAEIQSLERRGKYIFVHIKRENEQKTILIHLGMSGSVRIYDTNIGVSQKKHDHLIIKTKNKNEEKKLVLNDPRRFGGVDIVQTMSINDHVLIKNMGVEPLGNNLNDEYLKEKLKNKEVSIKQTLLDQKIIAGIGNIYASEILYRIGVSPKRLSKNLTDKKIEQIIPAIRNVLNEAIDQGGTSLRDHVQPGGEIGYFKQSLAVYGRKDEPCNHCGTKIKEIKQNGRASFYCSKCQR